MGLFDEQVSRKPNRYPWTQDFINSMWSGHWTPNEFDFKGDIQNFRTDLSPEAQRVVERTLSAIGQIEIAVKKFWSRLGDTLPHPGITDLGLVMAGVEVIHNQAYEKLLTVLQLNDVFEKNLESNLIKGRVKYLRKYLDQNYEDDRKQFVYSLILFTLFVENVSLFSQFYVIMWFNRYMNVLKDTDQQVKYTKNEEALHAEVGIRLVNTLREEYPELFDSELEERIKQEAVVAFECESDIVAWILGDFKGTRLSVPILQEYIKDRINESLTRIGFSTLFEVDERLIEETMWMHEEVKGVSKTDFFYKKPVDYAKRDKVFRSEDLF